jgi:hypothetical protein
MKHRYLLPLLLLLVLLVAAAPALAARPVPAPERVQGTAQPLNVAQPAHVNVSCTLGVTGDPSWAVNYLAPPDDSYYTLLDPSQCNCSNPPGVLLAAAHVLLYFPTLACSIPVQVSVVAADLTDPLCPMPLPTQYLCAPVAYTLTAPSAGLWNFNMALDAGCCITAKAFLKVEFTGAGTCTTLPRLVTTDGCEPCLSWNGYGTYLDELCGDAGFPGNVNMYVDATCCDVVSAHGSTWGRLKMLYR